MADDPGNIPLYILLLVGIALLNAFISLCEAAYRNVNVNTLFEKAEDEPDNKSIAIAATILKKPFRLQFTDTMLKYILAACGTMVAVLALPYNDIISAVVYVFIFIAFADLFPEKIALQHTDTIVANFAGFQNFLFVLFYPIVLLFTGAANVLLLMFRQKTKIEFSRYSEEEVMSILEAGKQSGEINEEGKKMINSIFEFDDELAYEIMTPRTDVFMIDVNDPPSEYLDELMELRYSRIPVYEDDSDNIIGILHIKDFLIKARESGFDNVDIRSILRDPYFVPDTKNIDALFFELQREKQHIAILIDEYGGFSGIVTMEDIIEEIMGDINDEYDQEETSYFKVNDNSYIVNGMESLDDLNEELSTDLESENSETIGGLIIDLLGEIPDEDDINRVVKYKNYVFTILSVKERRIEEVKMEILPVDKGGDEDKNEEE
ncbi:MAG: hemolysin family protein [Eubacterium sp.]|jgi:putative hemolysin